MQKLKKQFIYEDLLFIKTKGHSKLQNWGEKKNFLETIIISVLVVTFLDFKNISIHLIQKQCSQKHI